MATKLIKYRLSVEFYDPDVSADAVWSRNFGQRTLEALAQASYTRGTLPKVMAAYNAGPSPVARWNSEINDQGDPLLWMESIPYWETRGYVAIVMRNYWMYQRIAGSASDSRLALAQGEWPGFPRASRQRFTRID